MRPTPADPAARNAYLAEGNATQARKRVAADVLLRDPNGRVLLVRPTYKPGWDLPGGMAEANEPPHDAATRELREELGLAVTLRDVLVIDWVAPHGPWDDQISFIFDAGTLGEDQAAGIRPRDDEVAEVAFLFPERAGELLPSRLRDRFHAALRALADGRPRYLHDAQPIR
ncbi:MULTISPECIES: NUDIX domain-containing protein [Streptomycetaceae]|uniref:NUDIX hydrolase n=1 Tax=Streptantibioticus cattleyicolor (strain ATCC 35852 / DSM 46488 / JCM 4925 / NBRC 14057 / NRRL 8057) TaxID=1003195 RepID=F8JVG6_STREN|nr:MULTISPECIES: NUDIX hydrolase [Streptomycetaceae]AEW95668.1 NUDIX hydrolase [Streptantibioticus cattleyicolor NRRL 8057 = DSM 46488]MYS60213.1 NUDIX domain-containing protein [Streptomyces sp. SID5468]CCB76003.1 NUDIX hydrolase [Streptantibioticus cattleyicolor NRRL 8057 = DSM 46488]